ncbi:MAG TPA: hypothetical protein VFA34_03820 [Actinomycetota bacterium]|nr:hypothetical protein [Actinomycetota bacterium]
MGTQTIRFEVRADTDRPLRQVDLFIDSQDPSKYPHANANADGQAQPVLTKSYPDKSQSPPSEIFTFSWDSVNLTKHNGAYKLRVVAIAWGVRPDGRDSHILTSQRRDMRVDNPPKALAAPRIVAKTADTISVEWDKASEPDVTAYTLYRATTKKADAPPPFSSFKEVANGPETAERDTVGDDGVYWYTVIVTRRSVVSPQGQISGPPSPISKAAEVNDRAVDEQTKPGSTGRVQPRARVVSRLPNLTLPSVRSRTPPVPDAPFSAFLPYDVPEGGENLPDAGEPGAGDPRGPVLPVAVGAFLVSSALALGRMPY